MRKTILLSLIVCLTAGIVSASIKKGPYLIYPGVNDEMQVLWQVSGTETCTLEWGEDTSYSSGPVPTTQFGSDHQHEHVITGLTPGVKYYYRVTEGGGSHTGSFTAAPADVDVGNVKFLAFGDTRTNPDLFNQVSDDIITAYTSDPDYQSLILLAGDWSYRGEEARWTNEFFNRGYSNNLEFQANIPITGCIGNHEDDGGVYRKYYPYPYVSNHYWSFDYGPVHVAVIDTELSGGSWTTQVNWLATDLASTTKEWKIILLHKPGWSAGDHTVEAAVQNNIQPLCKTYGVDLVIAGHNHNYARCVVDGVHHITTGGGGAPLNSVNMGWSYVVAAEKTLNYCKIDIQDYDLTFTAIRSPENTVIESFSIQHALTFVKTIAVDPEGVAGAVDGCEFSKDGVYFAASDNHAVARIYLTEDCFKAGAVLPTGKVTHKYHDHTCADRNYELNATVWSHDGQYFATGRNDDGLKVWRTDSFFDPGDFATNDTPDQHLVNGTECDGADFSPNNLWVATAADKNLKVFRLSDFFQIATVNAGDGAVNSVDFSSDSSLVAFGASNGQVKIVTTSNWSIIKSISSTNSVKSVRFSPDDQYLAYSGRDQRCKVYRTSDWSLVVDITHLGNEGALVCDDDDSNAAVEAVEWSSDSAYLLTSGLISGVMHVWDTSGWPSSGSISLDSNDAVQIIQAQEAKRQIEFIDVFANLVIVGGDEGNVRMYEFARFDLSADEFFFTAYSGGAVPADQTLTILNACSGELSWQIEDYDCSWLSVTPLNGVSTGDPNIVTLSVDPNGLSSGVHRCTLTVYEEDVPDSPQTVEVSVYIASQTPVAHWPFDQNPDDIEGGHDGTLVNGAAITNTAGQFRIGQGAVTLDGFDDYVSTNYAGILGSAARTTCAWIKTDQSDVSDIMTWGGTGSIGGSWMVQVETGKLRVVVWGSSKKGTTTINDGQWHHIAVVLPQGGSSDDIELYVDGFPEATTSGSDIPITTAFDTDIIIGGIYYGGNYIGLFNGQIDDVRVYDRELTDAEIFALYTNYIADIDGDGKVTIADFAILASQWEKIPGTTPSADIAPLPDGDNFVDFQDLQLLALSWMAIE